MKSKKLLSLLLALAMVMSMAACGAKTNEPPATSGTPSETGAPATEELNWPTKEITLIQPWSLGGGPDVITRQIASYSDKILGVPMIVENHTGGSGTIGMNDFLEAEDDGYTLFCCNGPLFSLTPSFIDVDYTIDDISPICGIRITEFVILSNASSYTMISALFALLDIPCEAVPYDGGQEAINALVGGHVDIAIGSPPTYRDYVINGQLNCLGTFIPEGLDVEGIGHIASFKEQGIDVEFTGMDYLAVRSSVDPRIQEKLREFVLEVYADPEFQAFMAGMGMKAWDSDAAEILSMIDSQTEAMSQYIPLVQ